MRPSCYSQKSGFFMTPPHNRQSIQEKEVVRYFARSNAEIIPVGDFCISPAVRVSIWQFSFPVIVRHGGSWFLLIKIRFVVTLPTRKKPNTSSVALVAEWMLPVICDGWGSKIEPTFWVILASWS